MGQFGYARETTTGARDTAGARGATPGKRTLTEDLPVGAPRSPAAARPLYGLNGMNSEANAFAGEDPAVGGGNPPAKDDEPQGGVAGNPLRGLRAGDGEPRGDYRQRAARVRLLRDKLNQHPELGPLLADDGPYDAGVAERVRAFEAAQSLAPSGNRLNDATADKLWDRKPPELDHDPPADNPLRALRPGDGVRDGRTAEPIKADVRKLQELLRKRLPADIPVDGMFWVGNGTLQAWEDWCKLVNGKLDFNDVVDRMAIDLLVQGNKKEKPAPTPPPKDRTVNGIEGLRFGDGTTPATENLRRFVRKLQELLNEHSDDHDSVLEVSGRFDQDTLDMLHEFQRDRSITPKDPEEVDHATAQALHAGHRPNAGPWPEVNPELEDTMDAIWLQHQLNLALRNTAIDGFEKDLAKPDEESKSVLDFVAKQALAFCLNLLFSEAFGDGVINWIQHAVDADNSGLSKLQKDNVIAWAVKAPFDAAKTTGQDAAKEAVNSKSESTALLRGFIDGEHIGVIRGSSAAQETFLTQGKAGLRKFPDEKSKEPPPDDHPVDPRLKAAKVVLEKARLAKEGAARDQHDRSLSRWALTQAQIALGKKKSDRTGELGTDLGDVRKAARAAGVLRLTIEGKEPSKPVRVKRAEILGLSEITRAQIQKARTPIGDLGIPRTAMGYVGPVPGTGGDGFIRIAHNEGGDAFESDSQRLGKLWLQAKARGNFDDEPSEKEKTAEAQGARIVFRDDIDQTELSDALPLEKP